MHSDICRQVNAGRWMQKTVNWKRTWVDIHTSASAYILWGMQSGFSVGGESCLGPVSCWPSFSVGVRRRLVFCCRFKCLKSVVLTLFTHAHQPFMTPLCLYFPSPTHRHTLPCYCSCYSSVSSFGSSGHVYGQHLTTACLAIGFRKCRCPYSAFIRPRSMQLRPSAKRCARKYIFSN